MYTKVIFTLLCTLSIHSTQCMLGGKTPEAEYNKGGVNPEKDLPQFHRTQRAVGLRYNKAKKAKEDAAQKLKAARAAREKKRRALQALNRRTAAVKDYSTEYEGSSSAYEGCSDASNTPHHNGASASDWPQFRAPRAEPSCLAITGYTAAAIAAAVIVSPFAQKALSTYAAEMIELRNSSL